MNESPLRDRIRWIIQHGRKPDGKRWTMSSLARAAGLSRGYVHHIIEGKQDPDTVSVRVLNAIALAADVSPGWLLSGGAGGMIESVIDEAYPSRSRVIVMAREKGWDEAAIKALLLQQPPDPEIDPGERWWAKRLLELIQESRWFDRELQRVDELDEPESS